MIILYNCPIKICLILKCGKIFFEISPEFGRSQLSFDFEEKSENRTNLQPARNWSTDVAVILRELMYVCFFNLSSLRSLYKVKCMYIIDFVPGL